MAQQRKPYARTTTQRGYGAAHQRERRSWQPLVDAGMVTCWRCGQPIAPGTAWDLGHLDDRSGYGGPEHARTCNRAAGARKANALRRARRHGGQPGQAEAQAAARPNPSRHW